jgi:hypothetical protein
MVEFGQEQEQVYRAALVRFYWNGKHKGAGVLVAEGYVLTCAHVLAKTNQQPDTVDLDFPLLLHPSGKLSGNVVYWDWDKDIAGVQLLSPAPGEAQPLPFPASNYYTNDAFRVYGFPEKNAIGAWAEGRVIGGAGDGLVQIQGESAEGYAIEPGFSGAPVWDTTLGRVIGLARLRDKERPLYKVGYLIPYRILVPAFRVGDAMSLATLLLPHLDEIQTSVTGALRVCWPEGALAQPQGDLLAQLKALGEMPDGPTEYPPLVRFAVCLTLAKFAVPSAVNTALQQWLQTRSVDVKAVIKAITPQVNDVAAQTSTEAAPHLLIWLSAHHSQDTYPVEAVFIPDAHRYEPETPQGFESLPVMAKYDRPITPEQLPTVIQDCLTACQKLCADTTTLTIDLLLPLPLLQQALEWGPAYEAQVLDFLDPDPIAIRYPFMVRSSERLLKEYGRNYGQMWRNKWTHLQAQLDEIACRVLQPVSADVDYKQLVIDLRAPDKVGVKMPTPPPATGIPIPLKGCLATGAPVAIWLRTTPTQVNCCTEDLDSLLDCCLHTLRQSVCTARQTAFPLPKDAHIGHHLSLLWEDPHLVPPATKDLAS